MPATTIIFNFLMVFKLELNHMYRESGTEKAVVLFTFDLFWDSACFSAVSPVLKNVNADQHKIEDYTFLEELRSLNLPEVVQNFPRLVSSTLVS